MQEDNMLNKSACIKRSQMRNIVLVSHGSMAKGVQASLEMIIGLQEHLHVVDMPEDGDNVQFEKALCRKIESLEGDTLIIADILL